MFHYVLIHTLTAGAFYFVFYHTKTPMVFVVDAHPQHAPSECSYSFALHLLRLLRLPFSKSTK